MGRISRLVAALALAGALLVTGCAGPVAFGVSAGDPYYHHYRRPVGYFDITFVPYDGYWYRDYVYHSGYWYRHGWSTPYYDYYWGDTPYWYYW